MLQTCNKTSYMHTLLLIIKPYLFRLHVLKRSRSIETRFSGDSMSAQTDAVQFVHESTHQFYLIDSTQ